MTAFADLMAREEPALAPLLESLSDEIATASAIPVEERVIRRDRLAEWTAGEADRLEALRGCTPSVRLDELHRGVAAQFEMGAKSPRDTRLRALRPEEVCARRSGHPVVVAALVAAVAEQAGLPIGIATSASGGPVLLAHRGAPQAGAIIFGAGERVDVDEVAEQGRWRWICAHEVAAVLLELMAERSRELGLHPVHVAARRLTTLLPLARQARERGRVDLARAMAAYN
ncbi:MAG: hypothetical protein PGN13_00840 [Patulibacter minatonensis]